MSENINVKFYSNMKEKCIYLKIAVLATLLLCGCSSDENARYVESGGARSIISANKINIADWNTAAASLTNELLSSGALDTINEPKPLRLLVSRIVNRTSENIDTDMLTKQITIVLGNSGKVRVISSDSATRQLADKMAKEKGISAPAPKITLTGKIIEDRERNSSMKEITFTFFLEVNYMGEVVWAGQKQLTKQQKTSSIGW